MAAAPHATGLRALLFALAATIVLCLCLPQKRANAGVYDTPFTQNELVRFMRTWPTFVSWARANDVVFEDEDSLIGYVWEAETAEYLAQRGWKPERFFTVAHRASLALVNLQMQRLNLQLDEEHSSPPPFVDENPHISEQQKRMMSSEAEEVFGRSSGKNLRLSDAELRAVMPHEERLFRMMLR